MVCVFFAYISRKLVNKRGGIPIAVLTRSYFKAWSKSGPIFPSASVRRVGLSCWGLARRCRQRLLFFFQQRCFILANKQNLHNVVNLSKIKCYHDTKRSWSRPTLRPKEEWKCHCQVSCQKFVWRLAANPHLSLLQVKKSYRYFDLYDPHTNTSEIDMNHTLQI